MRRRLARFTLAASVLALPATAAPEGLTVVSVEPGSPGEATGVRAGDVLLRWSQGDASGELLSPFDLAEVELERAPRGPVRIEGRRGADALALDLFPDGWGVTTRADALPDADREPWLALEAARAADARRDVPALEAAVERGVASALGAGRREVAAQLLVYLGWQLRWADRLAEAQSAFARALEIRRALDPASLAAAALGEPIALVAYAQGGPEDQRDRIAADAQAAVERLAPDSILHARTLAALGWLQKHPDAERSFARAQELVDRLAPASLAAATICRGSAWIEANADRRMELNRRALRIQEAIAPETLPMVSALSAMASSSSAVGDEASAGVFFERALELVERLAPGSAHHATVLNNMGTRALLHGDLAGAEALLRRAIGVEERRGAGPGRLCPRLFNLGVTLFERRDFERAEAELRKALALSEQFAPGGALSGRILYSLSDVRRARGDLDETEALLRRSLDILATRSPVQHVQARRRLADVLAEAGRDDEAEALYRELSARTKSYTRAQVLLSRGTLALRRGDLETARTHLREALDSQRALAPGTTGHAETSQALGRVERRAGQPAAARALFEEAIAALEEQTRRLGGSPEDRARFRSHFQTFYRELEDLLIELAGPRQAFAVVERARARGLPALLAARDLALDADVPPELARERRQADRAYDGAMAALQEPSLAASEREVRESAAQRARQAKEEVRARMRSALPRLAALRDPQPLDLDGARRVLSPGTLLLSYSVGAGASRVYAVGPGPDDFAVFAVPAGSDALRREVTALREAIDRHRAVSGSAAVTASARRLSELVLRPVGGVLAKARQLVVVPDGPLAVVPWSALPSPADSRPLVESLPVHTVSSVTLYEILARRDSGGGSGAVVAFGDPASPPAAWRPSGDERDAQALPPLPPLPATRREVAALRALRADALILTGRDATEERARSVRRDTRFVHFACHALLDERFPLESGLVLAASQAGAENGFLQAWEVFESLRIDADLVTLSACRTGLGRETDGEGLLGLTWAFQYAGARSVLASLWAVNDASTAALMTRFYRHVAKGVSKAEALRRAQAELRARRTTAAPYFWAGFTLVGDGR